MKLLSKPEINTDNSILRKRQIDDGLAVARKIDVMRGEMSSLEKQRNDFIEQSKFEIEKQLSPLYQKLESLKGEITSLEAKRTELKKPLNEEWAIIKEAQEELKEKEKGLKLQEEALNAREDILQDKESEIGKELARIRITKLETERDYEETKLCKIENEKLVKETKEAIGRQDEIIADRLAEVRTLENEANFQKQTNKTIAEQLDIKEKALDFREKQIEAEYKMLLKVSNVAKRK